MEKTNKGLHLFGIFLSSTNDPIVQKYRMAARSIIESPEFSHRYVAQEMSKFPPSSKTSLTECERYVTSCHVYVGILGPFYGSLNQEVDLSYTEYEFKTAVEAQLDIAIFLLPDSILNESDPQHIIAQAPFLDRQVKFRSQVNSAYMTRAVESEEDFKERFTQYLRGLNVQQIHPLTVSESKPFLGESPLGTYDERPVQHYSTGNLSQELLTELLKTPMALTQMDQAGVLSISPDEHLKLIGLADEHGHPLLGTVLSLGTRDQVQARFDACALHMVVFGGVSKANSRTLYIEEATDNLVNLYRIGMRFFRTNAQLQRVGEIGTGERDELEIPTIALREALANALVHRDYEDAHLRVQPTTIEVFADRIEITSFGSLVRGVSEKALNENPELVRSQRRNPRIAKIFMYMQLVELNASGISRMREAMSIAGLPYPIVNQTESNQAVTVTFFRPAQERQQQRPLLKPSDDQSVLLEASHAVLAKEPSHIPHRPRRLIGRESLLARLVSSIADGRRVLLQGFGGAGKTAIASRFAADWLINRNGPVLWLEIGYEQPDAIFEALARPFNASQLIASKQGDSKLAAMAEILSASGVRLLVLDNAWDGLSLKTVLNAIPDEIPVIVTSRNAYPLDMRFDVDELAPVSAAETLAFYAGNPSIQTDPATAELCKMLGYLAFALEIAGKLLMAERLTPAQLQDRIKGAPHKVQMPRSFSEEGRRSVGDLLETSLAALDEQTRNIYSGFGAFFARQVTPKMLQLLFVEKPDLPTEVLTQVQAANPQTSELNDEEIANLVFLSTLHDLDLTEIDSALHTLMERGLVERVDATTESVTAYRIHDLAHSYLKAQIKDDVRARALDACLTYMALHDEPSLENFAALLPELDNLMGAALWAYSTGRDAATQRFASDLYMGSEFLDYRGYYGHAARLLQNAAHAAERQGNLRNYSTHLGNLGNTYFFLGDYPKAIDFHAKALATARQIGDRRAEGILLGQLGNAHYVLGDYSKALAYNQQALEIQRQINDKSGEVGVLGNLGNAYDSLGDYPKAIDFYQQALAISGQIGDNRFEG